MTDQPGGDKREFVEYDLMQNAHRVIINYDEESGLFKAYVDDIPTTQVYGKTKGEAFAHLMQIFYPQSQHPEDL